MTIFNFFCTGERMPSLRDGKEVWPKQEVGKARLCFQGVIRRVNRSFGHKTSECHSSSLLADPATNFAAVGLVCECVCVCACIHQAAYCVADCTQIRSFSYARPKSLHSTGFCQLGTCIHGVCCMAEGVFSDTVYFFPVVALDLVGWQSKSLNSSFIRSVNLKTKQNNKKKYSDVRGQWHFDSPWHPTIVAICMW